MPVDAAYTAHFNSAPFTLGVTEPHAGNTGYGMLGYTPASLNDVSPASPYVLIIDAAWVTANGSVLEGKRIHGMVHITANNVTVQGCEIVGKLNTPYPADSLYGLIGNTGTGNVIQYNTLTQWDASTSTDNSAGSAGGLDTYWMVGVILTGGAATVYRNDISNVNDTVYITGGTHNIQGNYLHDLMFRNDDADQSGNGALPYWSHNDGVQVMGGTNHDINGNSFVLKYSDQTGMNRSGTGVTGSHGTGNPNPDPYAEQQWPNCHGILMENANNAVTGVRIRNNWFKYGTAGTHFTLDASHDPGGAHTLTGNRFTPDQGVQFSQYRQIVVDPTTSWGTITVDNTNVYSHDPDTPAAVQGLPLNGNPSGNPFTVSTVKDWAYNSGAHTP